MQHYLANATAHLYSLGLQVEHPPYNAAIIRIILNKITEAYLAFDRNFVQGLKPQAKDVPQQLREHFFSLENTVRFDHGRGTYRMGIVDTGLRSDHYKPSGENLEALALLGMIVEEKDAAGGSVGSFGAFTMVDEAGILTSSKIMGNLVVVNVFYPIDYGAGADQYDLNQNKMKLQKAHRACDPEFNEALAETGLLEIANFSFETILRALQREKVKN